MNETFIPPLRRLAPILVGVFLLIAAECDSTGSTVTLPAVDDSPPSVVVGSAGLYRDVKVSADDPAAAMGVAGLADGGIVLATAEDLQSGIRNVSLEGQSLTTCASGNQERRDIAVANPFSEPNPSTVPVRRAVQYGIRMGQLAKCPPGSHLLSIQIQLQGVAENFLGQKTASPEVTIHLGAATIRVATFNVRQGALPSPPEPTLVSWGRNLLSKADIVFLNEVRSDEHVSLMAQSAGLPHSYSQGDPPPNVDVAILSRYPLLNTIRHVIPLKEILEATVRIEGIPHQLLATHFHHFGKPPWEITTDGLASAQKVRGLVTAADIPTFFGGDLNACAQSARERASECEGHDSTGAVVNIIANHLTDAFTASPPTRHCSNKRIDFIFFRGPYKVKSYESCFPEAEPSDHPFVLVTLEHI